MSVTPCWVLSCSSSSSILTVGAFSGAVRRRAKSSAKLLALFSRGREHRARTGHPNGWNRKQNKKREKGRSTRPRAFFCFSGFSREVSDREAAGLKPKNYDAIASLQPLKRCSPA